MLLPKQPQQLQDMACKAFELLCSAELIHVTARAEDETLLLAIMDVLGEQLRAVLASKCARTGKDKKCSFGAVHNAVQLFLSIAAHSTSHFDDVRLESSLALLQECLDALSAFSKLNKPQAKARGVLTDDIEFAIEHKLTYEDDSEEGEDSDVDDDDDDDAESEPPRKRKRTKQAADEYDDDYTEEDVGSGEDGGESSDDDDDEDEEVFEKEDIKDLLNNDVDEDAEREAVEGEIKIVGPDDDDDEEEEEEEDEEEEDDDSDDEMLEIN